MSSPERVALVMPVHDRREITLRMLSSLSRIDLGLWRQSSKKRRAQPWRS